MTVDINQPLSAYPDGPTAGPAGEHIFWDACVARELQADPFGVEVKLNNFALMVSREAGSSWASDPDFIVSGYRGHRAIQFGAEVKGVMALRDNPLTFTVPDRSVKGMVRFAASHRMWGMLVLVAWGGQDIRVATPAQVVAQGAMNYEHGYWWVNAAPLPTLDSWLEEYPSFVGGALALLPQPQAASLPNVVQLPRAA
jgi:hypothetical protein